MEMAHGKLVITKMGKPPNFILPKIVIISLCTSPKSICMHVEETIRKHQLKKLETFITLNIWYPNVAFFGVLEPPFTCQQENMKILPI